MRRQMIVAGVSAALLLMSMVPAAAAQPLERGEPGSFGSALESLFARVLTLFGWWPVAPEAPGLRTRTAADSEGDGAVSLGPEVDPNGEEETTTDLGPEVDPNSILKGQG